MNRWTILFVLISILTLGCSGGGGGSAASNPIAPPSGDPYELSQSRTLGGTHVWGYYDIHIDLETADVEAVNSRNTMFTANVTNFLNGIPPRLGFDIKDIIVEAEYTEVDIDVSLIHPFPGMTQYNGYDVRGVFMGNGSASLNNGVIYPVRGEDQYMLADPVGGNGAPDGYTRWFNITEFSEGGLPLVNYTPGDLATPGFDGSATLCPYKYFADGLDPVQDIFGFLAFTDGNGTFTAGATNTRNYYLRFPSATSIEYGYAVIANWDGEDSHPANAPEAQACMAYYTGDVYYIDETDNGGNLILDIDVFMWEAATGGPPEHEIIIESTVLSLPQYFDGGSLGTSGGENISTYHVEIPADNVTSTTGNEFWVIIQLDDYNYANDFGSPNLAQNDPLAAYFRFDLEVSGTPSNTPPNVTGIEDEEGSGSYQQLVTVNDVKEYWAIFDDPDTGQSHTFIWYVNADGTGTPEPADEVTLPIDWGTYGPGEWDIYVDVNDGFDTSQGGPYDLTVTDETGSVITFGGTGTEYVLGFCVDDNGAKLSGGYFYSDGNLDPDGNAPITSVGGGDMWLNKIDASGDFEWGYSWGDAPNHDYFWGIVTDDDDNIYACGHFTGTVDFDPDPVDEDIHVASSDNGRLDACLMKFDTDGNYIWGESWGGTQDVTAFDLEIYNDTYLYITGYFFGTADIDPTSGTDTYVASSSSGNVTDGYIIKLDLDGNYEWGRAYGAGGTTYSFNIAVDGSGNPIATGNFYDTVDLDPSTGNDPHTAYSSGTYDAFLVKLDGSGNYEWGISFGGDSWDKINDLIADSSGNVYGTGGYSSTTCDFDPGAGDATETNNGSYDGFTIKFNSSGVFQWVDIFGEPDHDNTWGIVIDSSGDLLMTGHFKGTMDFNPGSGTDSHTAVGEADAYVVKLDTDGVYIWGSTWGGTGFENGYAVDVGPTGFIHVTGRFDGLVDFNPGPGVENRTSNGGYDTFINLLLPNGGW